MHNPDSNQAQRHPAEPTSNDQAAPSIKPNKKCCCCSGETFKSFKSLFYDTFKSKSAFQEEKDRVYQSLCTRAWVIHCVVTASRVIYATLGISISQKAFSKRHENPELDQEFVDAIEQYVKLTIIGALVVAVLLDVFIWRYRKYAIWLMYSELVYILIHGFVPYNFGDFKNVILLIAVIQTFLEYSVDLGRNIIACTLTDLVLELAVFPFMYLEEWNFAMVTGKLLNTFGVFALVSVASMIVTYIVQIRGKMGKLMDENIGLLNRMHEGLIVFAQTDLSTKFASNPAISLIKQTPEQASEESLTSNGRFNSHEDKQTDQISQSDLKKPLFKPTQVSVKNVQKLIEEEKTDARSSELQSVQNFNQGSVSLEQIINEQLSLSEEVQSDKAKDDQGLNKIYQTLRFGDDQLTIDGRGRSNQPSRQRFKKEYVQVRAKKINYLESAAIAVYFLNMTHHVNQLHLESQFLEQKNRNDSLESYTSTISHEFRTPLSTTLMFLETLLDMNLGPETDSLLNMIISQLNMLLCLVNDVLDLKMIKQDKYETKISKFDPITVLDFIKDMFKPQCELVGNLIVFKTVAANVFNSTASFSQSLLSMPEEPLPEHLFGDQIRLKQILINLVKNSMKFTQKGNILIVCCYDKQAEMLHVSVIDNGRGISSQDISKLFTMFGKLLRTAQMNHEGIGMGLMICQNLVQMNQGTITVHSDGVGKGSNFTFTMKMALQEPSTVVKEDNLVEQEGVVDFTQARKKVAATGETELLLDRMKTEEDKEPVTDLVAVDRVEPFNTDQDASISSTRQMLPRKVNQGIVSDRQSVGSKSIQLEQEEELIVFKRQPRGVQQKSDTDRVENSAHLSEISLVQETNRNKQELSRISSNEDASAEISQLEKQVSKIMEQPQISNDRHIKGENQTVVVKGHDKLRVDEDDQILLFNRNARKDKTQAANSRQREPAKRIIDNAHRLNVDDLGKTSDKQILVIDDDAFNVVAIQGLLQQFQFSADCCLRGADAVHMVKRRIEEGAPMYKLLLVDFSMPEHDGPTCIDEIREMTNLAGLADQMPFFAIVTAYREKPFKERAEASGIDSYVVKPLFKQNMHRLLIQAGMIE